jgi:hypothetical protein
MAPGNFGIDYRSVQPRALVGQKRLERPDSGTIEFDGGISAAAVE